MKVSVIIPTFNEENVILGCLESLGNQTYSDFEIIVVDDGSTDKTTELILNLQKNLKEIKLFKQKHKGPGAARNLGANKAKGEIFVFIDSDMTFDKNFIKNLIVPIEEGKAKGTFSKEEFVSNWDNAWARCWNINQNLPKKKRHPENYPEEDKVFRAILKSEFDRVNGFTPGGYTDDYSLFEKLGHKSKAAKNAKFYHKNPESLIETYNHARWVGKRPYKLGFFGFVVALIRSSFPASLFLGVIKSIIYQVPSFLFFKVVYDLGITVGIFQYILLKDATK